VCFAVQLEVDTVRAQKGEIMGCHIDGKTNWWVPKFRLEPTDQPCEQRAISEVGISDLGTNECVNFIMEDEGGKPDASCMTQFLERWVELYVARLASLSCVRHS
jgi:hypothetical protein